MAVRMAPANGQSGMASKGGTVSNMTALLGVMHGQTAHGQGREFLLLGWRRQRFLIQRGRLARLADILPEADIQRAPAAIDHQRQGQRQARFTSSDGQDEERKYL